MRFSVVFKYIGLALLLEALFMIATAILSLYDGRNDAFADLLLSGLLTAMLGVFPCIFTRCSGKLKNCESFLIVVGSWMMCCFMGMIPYLMYGMEFSFTDALFESVSGFTTTGASILNDIEALPRGLLFWRMSTAWIGGIGIIVIFSLLVPTSSDDDAELMNVEVSNIALGSSQVHRKNFVMIMAVTYIILTVVSTFALKICGMGWFDAITHAMSACSTCGFSTKNASIAAFESTKIEMVLSLVMILSSIRFTLYYQSLARHRLGYLFQSEVTKAFLISIFVGIVLLTAGLLAQGGRTIQECLRLSIFQTSSIFTTTGFATDDTNVWPPFCETVIICGSVVCGCSGSTSGGMKMDRFVLVCKALEDKIHKMIVPNSVGRVRIEGQFKPDSTVNDVQIFVIAYFLIIALGAVINSAAGLDLKTSWTGALACMSNVGPGFGMIGSMDNYYNLPTLAKYNSMILMLIGRLEIFPLMYILQRLREQ